MKIHVLSADTIGRIAAGEVVERPASVVKELVENAIDAGASAVTVEIRDGGASLIRVTDNGCGIEPEDIPLAFRRHATSKIRDDADLQQLETLGFRGEALASIAAVSLVEIITKTRKNLIGIRAVNVPETYAEPAESDPATEDAPRLETEEIGAPDGTTIMVRDLFYNVPVRKKFLRSARTETGQIAGLMEQFALSHPDISFHFRADGKEKLHTTGSGDLKELIYRIYGRETSRLVLPVRADDGRLRLEGFIGRPEASRGSRSFEVFFVNGRMLRSDLLSTALEMGYRTDLMQHRFPFAVLHLQLPPSDVDVNVHPNKMEIRFTDSQKIRDFIDEEVHRALHGYELIPEALPETYSEQLQRQREEEADREAQLRQESVPEPFEKARQPVRPAGISHGGYEVPSSGASAVSLHEDRIPYGADLFFDDRRIPSAGPAGTNDLTEEEAPQDDPAGAPAGRPVQMELFSATDLTPPEEDRFLTREKAASFRIVGQIFGTYWIVEESERLLLIDQHAAHEKINYEKIMRRVTERGGASGSQLLMPPRVVTLSGREEEAYLRCADYFRQLGYEIEDLGQGSYALRGIPTELFGSDPEELFRDTVDEIMGERLQDKPQLILSRIATMSCKAAVKGSTLLKYEEAQALIEALLQSEDPYHCPHGRPSMIILHKSDMDRKFKRLV